MYFYCENHLLCIFIVKLCPISCIRMLWTILNKSWKQHPTKQQLYGPLPPISKTIYVWQTRHMGHCWRSKDKLISFVFLWTHSHGCASVGWPERTYLQQLYMDTGCGLEELPRAMDDRDRLGERELGKSMQVVQLDDDVQCIFIIKSFLFYLKHACVMLFLSNNIY